MKALNASFLVATVLAGLLLAGLRLPAHAQNPIPSYNYPLSGLAVFVEPLPAFPFGETKRKLTVAASCTAKFETTCQCTVYVATTDQQTILGPYILYGGQTIEVDIDERRWGWW